MENQEYLLWTLYQDLYPKYLKGEVDEFYFNFIKSKLFSGDGTAASGSLESIESLHPDDDPDFPVTDSNK